MVEISLLAGKVVKWSLPEVQPGPGGNDPVLKRLMLPQGELAQFWEGDEAMRYIAAIELRGGSMRGNHVHKIKKEYVYMLSGEVLLLLQNTATKEQASTELRKGDLALIQPDIAHALQVIESGQAVEFSPNRFEAGDIYRWKLV